MADGLRDGAPLPKRPMDALVRAAASGLRWRQRSSVIPAKAGIH
jgi:hypothetical protein